jgi:hypothetical protein
MSADTTPALAWVDCETSGLDYRAGHRPWEVAVIVRHPDGGVTEHVWQVRPDLGSADRVALAKSRYWERCVLDDGWEAAIIDDAAVLKATARCVVDDIRQVLEGVTLVAANPAFDAGMLTALFHDHGLAPSWHYRLGCVENMVAGALHLAVPPGLKDAADLMGVRYDPDELHTALGDARLARDVYDAVMAGGVR